MLKRLNLLLIFLLVVPYVSAGLNKLEVPLTVDFISDNEFNLKWDGGVKNFRWSNTSFPSDTTFNMEIYRDLNGTVVCEGQSNTFNNLTNNMESVVETCKRLADNNNITLALELGDAQFSHGLQTEKLENCKVDLTQANERAALYESCETSKNSFKNKYEICEADLTQTQKSNKSNPFLVGAICFGIAYFIWGRKPKNQPSEIEEEGFDY